MKARIVIPLALIGLFSVGSAYAMTITQAKYLVTAACSGDTADLAKLEAAAKSGDAAAQTWLGVYWGVKKDYAKANYWYEKAAAQGYARAEYSLGDSYYHGRGVPQNYAKANYWYEKANSWCEKAAAQGNAWAELNLGYSYYHGRGVPQDTMTAITWLKKAAAQGGFAGRVAQELINVVERG